MADSYRFQIGSLNCLAVNDGETTSDAAFLFRNVPPAQLQVELERHGLQADRLPNVWSCLLVQTPGHMVLIDTGLGPGHEAGGQMLPALAAAGYQPEEIDTVILTHGHPDHIGGCTDASGNAAFPQARYVMARAEWDFWTSAQEQPGASEWALNFARMKLLPVAAQLTLVEGEYEVVPGIRLIPAPGHTVGHMAVEITSAGETLLHMGDAVLHQLQVAHADWIAPMDQDAEQTVATRQALYQRATAADALVLAYHFAPFPGLGHIRREGTGWTWEPANPFTPAARTDAGR